MGVSAGQILRQAARRWPDRIAIVDAGEKGAEPKSFTYAEIDQRARSVAARLVHKGVRPGSRVALVASNSDGFVASWFGIVKYSKACNEPCC